MVLVHPAEHLLPGLLALVAGTDLGRISDQVEERVDREVGLAQDRAQDRALEIARVDRNADQKLRAVRVMEVVVTAFHAE
jgi:hypothetical protein